MIASSSIYGQSLISFSEVLEQFQYFGMTASFNDNYTIPVTSGYNGIDTNYQVVVSGFAPAGTYLGVIFNDRSGVKDNNGNLVNDQSYILWAEETFNPGWFVKWNNTTFRLTSDNDWDRQGGFIQYILERVVGSDGQGTVPSNLSDGSGSYQ